MRVINDYSYLFRNVDKNTQGINLAEYASIKSGSYKKALRDYYNKLESNGVTLEINQKDTTIKGQCH